MKKFFRIFIKTTSLVALVLVVFATNVYSNLFKKSTKVKEGEGSERFFADAFSANKAFADVPGGNNGGSDGGSGGDDNAGGSGDSGGDGDSC